MMVGIEQTLDLKSIDNSNILSEEGGKFREQNRICQIAFKVRQKMPKDYESFCKVASHLSRNADRYFKSDKEEINPDLLHCDVKPVQDIIIKKEPDVEIKEENIDNSTGKSVEDSEGNDFKKPLSDM